VLQSGDDAASGPLSPAVGRLARAVARTHADHQKIARLSGCWTLLTTQARHRSPMGLSPPSPRHPPRRLPGGAMPPGQGAAGRRHPGVQRRLRRRYGAGSAGRSPWGPQRGDGAPGPWSTRPDHHPRGASVSIASTPAMVGSGRSPWIRPCPHTARWAPGATSSSRPGQEGFVPGARRRRGRLSGSACPCDGWRS
jgi:hypothetical protein